ncbi:esterase/lipase family protein [Rhodococcus kronopolitis]|uniref:Esterase/lipase family protein n=1 Tax=Rhodococcus kronopolitis TaxID=1460226 RepID=A0ABV9FPK4_9NOCA
MLRASRLVVLALSLLALVLPFGAGGAAAQPLPENYNFFAGIPNELTNPGGSLPGSNDFSCKPSAEHPRPVVLVHGTGGSQQTNWGAYVPMLKNAGFCVFAMTYGAVPGAPWPISAIGGMGPIGESAAQFKTFVDRVRSSTGAQTVDVVGHSQGTFVPTYYLKELGGAGTITNYVSIAPPWRGLTALGVDGLPAFAKRLGVPESSVPVCQACGEMTAESDVIKKVNAGGTPYVKGVNYTNISTRYDEAIRLEQGQVPGPPGYQVTNIVVQDTCSQDYSEHAAIAGSKRAAYMTLNALDPAHAREVPCMFVPPFSG